MQTLQGGVRMHASMCVRVCVCVEQEAGATQHYKTPDCGELSAWKIVRVCKLYIWRIGGDVESACVCVCVRVCMCVWCREAGLWSGAAAVGREPETPDCRGANGAESHHTHTHTHSEREAQILSGECKPMLRKTKWCFNFISCYTLCNYMVLTLTLECKLNVFPEVV